MSAVTNTVTISQLSRGQLTPPSTPKQDDADTERMRITDEQKLVELQTVVRTLITQVTAQNTLITTIIATLHTAGVAGF